MEKIIVTTTVPGRHRGGEVFAGTKEFPIDHFTRAQLEEIMRDSVLSVGVGRVLKPKDLDAMFAKPKAEK